MRRAWLPLGLVVVLGVAPWPTAAKEPAKEKRPIARLIARLGSASYEEREEATRALDALGESALPLLRKAMAGDDAEVVRRATELVEAIELRQRTQQLLRPSRVRLTYKDVKVADVVADLARRTGNHLQVSGAAAARKITLDTGEVEYWEALAKLCEAAGLHERPPDATPAPQPINLSGGRVARGRRVMVVNNGNLTNYVRGEGPMVLEDGKGPRLAQCHFGALRVRALPPGDPPKDGKLLSVVLEIKPEGSVSWEALASVHIDKAIDDQGQTLDPAGLFVGKQDLPTTASDETILIVDGEFRWPTNRGQRLMPLQFRKGAKPSKALRELTGTVGAWVRTPVEDLLTLDEPSKSLDKELHGADGAELRITEFATKGQTHQLRIEMTPPPPIDSLGMANGPIRVVVRGRGAMPQTQVSDRNGTNPFALVDARGKVIPLRSGQYSPAQNGAAKRIYTLTYQSDKEQGAPARLVYRGPRNAFVEAPFTLKDVPLVKTK
jgi:hypothetical protein